MEPSGDCWGSISGKGGTEMLVSGLRGAHHGNNPKGLAAEFCFLWGGGVGRCFGGCRGAWVSFRAVFRGGGVGRVRWAAARAVPALGRGPRLGRAGRGRGEQKATREIWIHPSR